MNASPRILYCHCAYAEILPADTKQAILAALDPAEKGDSPLFLEAVADLCELAARKDGALRRWAETPGLQVIACHPRAVRWLFAYAGAPLPADAVIHNMRLNSAPAILDRLHVAPRDYLAPGEYTGGNTGGGRFPPKKLGEWVPWFPVIDYDRCQGCRQCAEFCLFGVYAVEGGAARVVQPDHCKTGCPACARVCPHSAIIFPKFKDGPISGDEGELTDVGRDGLKADLAGLSRAQVMALLRRRSAARAKAAEHNGDAQEPNDE